jgi:hypothetical protein
VGRRSSRNIGARFVLTLTPVTQVACSGSPWHATALTLFVERPVRPSVRPHRSVAPRLHKGGIEVVTTVGSEYRFASGAVHEVGDVHSAAESMPDAAFPNSDHVGGTTVQETSPAREPRPVLATAEAQRRAGLLGTLRDALAERSIETVLVRRWRIALRADMSGGLPRCSTWDGLGPN